MEVQLPTIQNNHGVDELISENYILNLRVLCTVFLEAKRICYVVNANDFLEILKMAKTRASLVRDRINDASFMRYILHVIKLITDLDMTSDQQFLFIKNIYGLVRCQPTSGHLFIYLMIPKHS